ncbi:MAG: hypothetical protein U1C49_01295 [Candidatus Andersenbacteria bacterium]|nr:hypothetical protein [bacterium]MDZ4225461.1 hypothetical protein [Candidatus Andersenbacteria bacterium]
MSEGNKTSDNTVKLKLGFLGQAVIRWLSSSAARTVIFSIAGILVVTLLYLRAWKPLQQPMMLPPGVVPSNPGINTDLLQQINTQRVNRTSSLGEPFVTGQLFMPTSTNAGR